MNSIEEILIQQQRRAVHVGEDFVDIDSEVRFNVLEADSSTVALATGASAVGGALLFTSAATDNNEAYIWSNEVFKFAGGKSIIAEARIKYAEANTDDANIIFGLMSAVAANSLIDDGAGPQAAYSGAVIYKIDGEILWRAQAATNGGANKETGISTAGAGGSSWQTLRIEAHPLTATRMDVSFFIDDAGGSNFVPLKDSNLHPLKWEMDITTVTEMSVMFGVKAGGANSETPLLDKIDCVQIRA